MAKFGQLVPMHTRKSYKIGGGEVQAFLTPYRIL